MVKTESERKSKQSHARGRWSRRNTAVLLPITLLRAGGNALIVVYLDIKLHSARTLKTMSFLELEELLRKLVLEVEVEWIDQGSQVQTEQAEEES